QLARDELRGRTLREQGVEHVVTVEVPGTAEHGLRAVIMDERPEDEVAAVAVDAPAGEGPRRLLDVLLAVVAFAEREQLHHLTREILVRSPLAIAGAIEVDHHRRITGYGMQQVAKMPERVGAERDVLAIHEFGQAHFLLARHEMVVPE